MPLQSLRYCLRNLTYHVSHWPPQEAQGDVIVALHGFSGSGLDFKVIAENKSKKYAWYAPDFIGHGETDAPCALDEYKIKNNPELYPVFNNKFFFKTKKFSKIKRIIPSKIAS